MLKDSTARIKEYYLLLVKFNSIPFDKRLFSQRVSTGCILESPRGNFKRYMYPRSTSGQRDQNCWGLDSGKDAFTKFPKWFQCAAMVEIHWVSYLYVKGTRWDLFVLSIKDSLFPPLISYHSPPCLLHSSHSGLEHTKDSPASGPLILLFPLLHCSSPLMDNSTIGLLSNVIFLFLSSKWLPLSLSIHILWFVFSS